MTEQTDAAVESWADEWDVRPLIQERLAKAWDEGWSAGASRRLSTDNPYLADPIGDDAETLAMIRRLKTAHPVETCDLFRTVTGRCTCFLRVPNYRPEEWA